ncbi:MAG TPA: hypothetical protein VJ814_03700 [Gaiellaceae bacterium]|nr:hypothetical protein [Gaiellaceae bacterium]
MRRSILACGLLLAFAGMATAAAAAVGSGTTEGNTTETATTSTTVVATASVRAEVRARARAARRWRRHIRSFRAGTRRWLTVIRGRPPAQTRRSQAAFSLLHLRKLANRWRHREHAAWWKANHPPDFAAWLCIHRYEGSWGDSGGPYWGGLQMDFSFQATYGGWLLRHKGTADHWSPLEQIWVAVRASRTRGFSPWPNTARYCGVM